MDCLIRLVQADTALGNLGANLESHLVAIEAAIEAGVDLVIFPELSLTGYFLKDQTAEVALLLDAPLLVPIRELSKRISIVLGFVERAPDGRVFNAVGLFEGGELVHVHRKVHLVTYGMFEEARDLAAGEAFTVVESRHGRFGFLTCEDAWHVDGGYLYFLDGADAIIVCSAGPGRGVGASGGSDHDGGHGGGLASNRVWSTLQDAMAILFRTWILYVNRVGWEDGVVFGGATRAVDPFGDEKALLAGLDPGYVDVHMSSEALHRARTQTPLRRGEKPWILARELGRRWGVPRAEDDAEKGE